jgi:hypothetical protein
MPCSANLLFPLNTSRNTSKPPSLGLAQPGSQFFMKVCSNNTDYVRERLTDSAVEGSQEIQRVIQSLNPAAQVHLLHQEATLQEAESVEISTRLNSMILNDTDLSNYHYPRRPYQRYDLTKAVSREALKLYTLGPLQDIPCKFKQLESKIPHCENHHFQAREILSKVN